MTLMAIMLKDKVKFCINCKHFLPDNLNNIYGKCILYPRKEGKINYYVNGVNNEDYFYCSTARSTDDMCGEEGKKYKKKKIIKEKDLSKKNILE